MTGRPLGRRRGQSTRGSHAIRGTRGKHSTSMDTKTSEIKTPISVGTSSNEPVPTPMLYKDIIEAEPKYFDLQSREEIIPLEPEDLRWLNDPKYLLSKYLSQTNFPMEDSKPRMYYISILQMTESCDIKSFYHNNNIISGIINYSKCTINKVLSLIDWGMDAYKTRIIKHGDKTYQYNYWDYQNAWKKAFYYDNPKRKHSWFFFFHKEFFMQSKTIPLWFYNWWYVYGPPVKFLPDKLYQKYNLWVEVHPNLQTNNLIIGQSMFYFIAENFIPWIWKWGIDVGYNMVEIPYLYRTFQVRFWPSWQMQDTLDKIDQQISQFSQVPSTTINPSMDLLSLRKHFEKKFPEFTEQQILHKCMEYMKDQFSATFHNVSGSRSEHMSIASDDSLQFSQAPQTMEEIWVDVEKYINKGKGKMDHD